MSRRYLLEQIDDVAVVQYYADGFDALPHDQKLLVWHLYQAAIAGRDIYYDQRYRHALDMREVIEETLTHAADVDPDTLAEIRRYAKLFWINSGPHNNLTSRKFVMTCAPAAFRAAVHVASHAGAAFPIRAGETLETLLTRLEGAFFDPTVDPLVTNKAPQNGDDILAASANNLYVGVTMADLEGFEEKHGLNSRLVKRNGTLVEEVYRVDGRYTREIAAITGHLREALPLAPPPMRRALEALIRFYETGNDADRVAYDEAWVDDKDSPIDTINGFIENYLDARSVKGAWEALVFYVNHEKTHALQRLAEAAPWFEARMPWDPRWRRESVVGVTARAIDVVVETGDAGPVTAIGINLPNDQRIREERGSKSVSLANINEAYDKSQLPAYRREFCWDEDEVTRAEKWGAVASEATTAIHEVLGHGSGRVADHLDGQPQLALKEQYSALEEARADLVALYFVPEAKIAEVGIVPVEHQDEIVRTEYEAYARNALVQLRRVREGTTIEEDHMRNRQMIVRWLMAHTSAIDVRVRDGKTYYVMVDAKAFHEGTGRLLAEVQEIKSQGDYEAARRLFETHGIHFDPALRDEIVDRVDRVKLPSYTGFVQPRLEAVRDASGRVTDVNVSYPMDLEQQMLEYLGQGRNVARSDRMNLAIGRALRKGSCAIAIVAAAGSGRAQTAAPQTPVAPAPDLSPALARVLDPVIDAAWSAFDMTAAFGHVQFVTDYWRLPGNPGYDATLDRVRARLLASGFADGKPAGDKSTPGVVTIDSYPNTTHGWDHSIGTLSIVRSPGAEEIVLSRARERLALCINSFSTPPAGVIAPLIDVGRGQEADFAAKDVKGAVVLGDADVGQLWQRGVKARGAIGVVSTTLARYSDPNPPGAPPTPREDWDILQWGSVLYDESVKAFGFKSTPHAAATLRRALAAGPAQVHVTIASTFTDNPVRTLVAEIPGTTQAAERIVMTAHVQEPGANDNASGVATLAELARVLSTGIASGKIAPPARTLTFLWLTEISGSRRWLMDHAEQGKNVRYMFSMDMPGEDVSKTGGSFLIERWPDPGAVWDRPWDPHTEWGRGNLQAGQLKGDLLNDLHLAVCRRVARRSSWVVHTNPYEGGSDHTEFGRAGIPSVLDWHFTDRYYHSNMDTADKTSPAEMRNVGVSVAATAWLLASATEPVALDVADLVSKAGQSRVRFEEVEGPKLVPAATDAVTAREKQIVQAWKKWYGDAVKSTSRLIIGTPTAAFATHLAELAKPFID